MPYKTLATSRTPALIIYLLDVSASMSQPFGDRRRIDVVTDALQAALRQMVFRCTKGSRISPRYRIALFAYSDHVYDLLDGIKPVNQVARLGVPQLSPMRTTETAKAFAQAEGLLRAAQRATVRTDSQPRPRVIVRTPPSRPTDWSLSFPLAFRLTFWPLWMAMARDSDHPLPPILELGFGVKTGWFELGLILGLAPNELVPHGTIMGLEKGLTQRLSEKVLLAFMKVGAPEDLDRQYAMWREAEGAQIRGEIDPLSIKNPLSFD